MGEHPSSAGWPGGCRPGHRASFSRPVSSRSQRELCPPQKGQCLPKPEAAPRLCASPVGEASCLLVFQGTVQRPPPQTQREGHCPSRDRAGWPMSGHRPSSDRHSAHSCPLVSPPAHLRGQRHCPGCHLRSGPGRSLLGLDLSSHTGRQHSKPSLPGLRPEQARLGRLAQAWAQSGGSAHARSLAWVTAGGTPTSHPQVLSAFHVRQALSEGTEHQPAFQVQVIKVRPRRGGVCYKGCEGGQAGAQLGGLTQRQWDEHSASPRWWRWRWGVAWALGMDHVVLRQGSGQTGSKGRVGPSCLWRSW